MFSVYPRKRTSDLRVNEDTASRFGRTRPILIMRVDRCRREIGARDVRYRIGSNNGELVGLDTDAVEIRRGFAIALRLRRKETPVSADCIPGSQVIARSLLRFLQVGPLLIPAKLQTPCATC
jgi:hypothetical protein